MLDTQSLMSLGQLACDYLHNDIQLDAINHPVGFPCYRSTTHPAKQTTENMDFMFGRRKAIHQQLRVQRIAFYGENPTVEEHAEWATKLGFGSCDDFAVIAYHYLSNMNKDHEFHVGAVYSFTYDHVFLVLSIHPIPAQFVLSCDTGKTEVFKVAVVCDPWANHVFSVSDPQAVIAFFRLIPSFNSIDPISSGLQLRRKYPEWSDEEADRYE